MDADLLQKIIASLISALAFGVMFRAPRRYLHLTVLIGGVSSVSYYLFRPEQFPPVVWVFLISFAIGSLSHVMARMTASPAQGFLIPGIIVLVPGSLIYQGFSKLFSDRPEAAWPFLVNGIMVGIAISFGLLLANWIAPSSSTL